MILATPPQASAMADAYVASARRIATTLNGRTTTEALDRAEEALVGARAINRLLQIQIRTMRGQAKARAQTQKVEA